MKLDKAQASIYVALLHSKLKTTNLVLTNGNWFNAIHATKEQRLEALLNAIGKWVDEVSA